MSLAANVGDRVRLAYAYPYGFVLGTITRIHKGLDLGIGCSDNNVYWVEFEGTIGRWIYRAAPSRL